MISVRSQDPDQPHCARLCAVWQGLPANRARCPVPCCLRSAQAPFDEHFQWDTEKVGNDLAYYMDIYDEGEMITTYHHFRLYVNKNVNISIDK